MMDKKQTKDKNPPYGNNSSESKRGIYSDLLITSGQTTQQCYSDGPVTDQSLLARAIYEYQSRKGALFKSPPDLHCVKEKLWHGASQNDFSSGSFAPKVQLPFVCPPGQAPRKLEIERRRREYQKLDITTLLSERGIDSNMLMPRHQTKSDETDPETLPGNELPLEIFDNEEFDCRSPEEWLALGYEQDSSDRKPVPAKALLPTTDSIPPVDPKEPTLVYAWQSVGVLEYILEKKQYLVQKVDSNGQVRDSEGKPILNGGQRTGEVLQEGQYWVPRIRVLFCAEDPHVFAQRVQFAQSSRRNTEASILYHLSVDCMPVWSGTPTLDPSSLERMKTYAITTPGLHLTRLQGCVEQLDKEINLEYSRTMNQTVFDKVVQDSPEEFPFITILKKDPERRPERGFESIPKSPFEENRTSFAFNSLLTKPEVIAVLSVVREECSRLAEMSLFHVTFTHPLQLQEFVSAQSQKHALVQSFLQKTWFRTLCDGILSSLRDVNCGWYDLSVSCWDVYRMSKLRRLMALVQCIQQDSLRFLVQDSLNSLNRLLFDACHSTMHCPQDLIWGSDLINSPYKPKTNPVFSLDLVLDQTGVHYSTPLESFETSVINLFDKGILSTNNVPLLDKFIMKKLFIVEDVLCSVGLWEPEVSDLRERIRLALRQAIIPLRAYARQYERHLQLHNSDIDDFLEVHSQETQSPHTMKQEVLEHLKEMDLLAQSVPSSIIIGPFVVSIEVVRQTLLKKRKALANAVLERLVLWLRQRMQDACKECKAISKQLFEKPSSIEELSEQREWMEGIPEQLKVHEESLFKALSDYDLVDEFFYCFSDEDVNEKWAAMFFPWKILNQMETVREQHSEDEERFHKIQLVDQNNFLESLSELQMVVAGLAAHTNVERAHEVANKVRRVSKQLKECEEMAQLYNNRERLFGKPPTTYTELQRLNTEFQPFHDMWRMASDWLLWHESWLSDPLSAVNPEQLVQNVNDAYQTMQQCVQQFKDIPACQAVASEIQAKIEEFRPFIPLIRGLRKLGTRSRNWELLSERINMDVRPKPNLTFSHCLELGLQAHVEEVTRMAQEDGKE